MLKRTALLLALLICFTSSLSQAAQQPISIFDGYRPVKEAVKQFEELYQKKVLLPTNLPPLSFTHKVGKLDTSSKPSHLDISYFNKDNKKEHFKMVVRPANGAIRLIPRVDQTYKMKDGTKAIYRRLPDQDFSFFLFQKNGLEYHLAIHRQCGQKITVHDFARIAMSME